MQDPKVTSKGQTTLPTAVRAALKIDAGDTLCHIVLGGEFRLLDNHALCNQTIRNVGKTKSSVCICRSDC